MSEIEQVFCRSAPWRWFARDVVLPWALQGTQLSGGVLEIGSGSGAMAAGMLDRFADIHLTATDYDEQMVAVCQDRLAPYGDRARVVRADATALDFPDDTFNAVVSFIMLHHVIEWEQALRECTRVLKPGGVLVGYDLLENPVSRFVHVVDRSPYRLMTMSELDALVPQFPGRARVQPFLRHAAVRFLVDTGTGTGGNP